MAVLRFHSEAYGEDPRSFPRPRSSLSSENRVANSNCCGAVRLPSPTHQFGGVAAGGRLSSHRAHESQSSGQRVAQAPAEGVKTLIFPSACIQNGSVHCCANSTLQALHWLCSHLPGFQFIWTKAMQPHEENESASSHPRLLVRACMVTCT